MIANCHNCNSSNISSIGGYSNLKRISSDSKEFPAGAHLFICDECFLLQTEINQQWQDDCKKIYTNYAINAPSNGEEQTVFDSTTGIQGGRSTVLLERSAETLKLPTRGRVLDIGCGLGGFLQAFHKVHPEWELYGAEWDSKNEAHLNKIKGFRSLFTGPIDEIDQKFDLIVMIHSLEHIPHPKVFLEKVGSLLSEGGQIVIQLPDCSVNLFMLVVADHCSHFTPNMIGRLVESSGFSVVSNRNDWVSKEISLVAKKEAISSRRSDQFILEFSPNESIEWLREMLAKVQSHIGDGPLGVFGTAVAGSWIACQFREYVSYFVDEDPARVGGQHMGLPVFAVKDAPKKSTLVLAFPHHVAAGIRNRLAGTFSKFVMPPELHNEY